MRVLIFGLPGSGKTYLAQELVNLMGEQVAWFNADKVREEANDWDFSEEGRLRQKQRMKDLCTEAEAQGKIAIADFVCPFDQARVEFDADFTVWVDTIEEGRFADTNAVFEVPDTSTCDYIVYEQRGDVDAKLIAWELGERFIWDNKAPTTQMLGRWQPWHDGHQALFDRAIAKHGQVYLMIRDMPQDDQNPFSTIDVVNNLKENLVQYAGKVKISIVPNITNITYGRSVGYKIEQEVFDDAIHSISATKIREQMRKDGEL
jgi:adenylylsulfate kinase